MAEMFPPPVSPVWLLLLAGPDLQPVMSKSAAAAVKKTIAYRFMAIPPFSID
ncbi:hypothetical protein [Brevibacillus massiliensis]|uniref:hypothetical protein n=1 Tax=Brevibacillus massiliensis TaxID=1118054 RepID=UPI00036BF87F|nr:hypothetical protein [Brevibacillus massiliensis]